MKAAICWFAMCTILLVGSFAAAMVNKSWWITSLLLWLMVGLVVYGTRKQ